MGECVIVMPASIGVWDVCEGSDITDGSFVKMRGRNTRTARYRVFIFVVKSEIRFCTFVTEECEAIIFFDCRDRRPRLSKVVTIKK